MSPHLNLTSTAPHQSACSRRDLPDRVGERETLERHVAAWQRRRNAPRTKAEWRFTTADARIKLRKLYPTING